MGLDLSVDDLFQRRLHYPDPDARDRLDRLVGIDQQKNCLAKTLSVLLNKSGLREWARQHHPAANILLERLIRRPPLVILAGDIGSGKTELAESIGDQVARQERFGLTLFPLSLSTRGSGRVGEMTQLIASAFAFTLQEAEKLRGADGSIRGGVILFVDEADALVQSREIAQMHHEDRAGVNAFIRGVDQLAQADLPAGVILCTNRLSSIDPAVQRRAADIIQFQRPNDDQRLALLAGPLSELGFSKDEIAEIVKMTGPSAEKSFGFTYSDLAQRLLPAFVLDAYPSQPVVFARARRIAARLVPTPPYKESLEQ